MAPSDAEPTKAAERKARNLPPKSYADAVEQDIPAKNGSVGGNLDGLSNGANGRDSYPEGDGEKHTASVLRITDTGSGGRVEAKKTEHEDIGPELGRKESPHEYSAKGLDDNSKTPPGHRQRKMGPQKSSDSTGRSDNGNNRLDNKLQESNHDRAGDDLSNVKSGSDYDTQLDIGKKESKEPLLVSGRQAGQRWHASGMRFAPLNVPLQRRLQTAAVLFHTLTIGLFTSLFFFLCAIPLLWPIIIPYMIYCMTSNASTSGELSHRLEWMRSSSFWSLFASYFPARLHRTAELPATRKYIFGYHPHGIISHGAWAVFGTEALGFSQLFPGITNTLLTLDSNFRIPLHREYTLAMGLASVSKQSCENLLTKGGTNKEGMGRAITIVIGGVSESLDAQPFSLRLVLKRRKGFIKLAIRTGADLVPVLAFGENDLYDQLTPDNHPRIHKFQLVVKKVLGFTIPFIHARGVFNYDVGLLPYRRPLDIVVGRPVMVVQAQEPRQEDIDRVHEEYISELERLWHTYKDRFAPNRESELEILK